MAENISIRLSGELDKSKNQIGLLNKQIRKLGKKLNRLMLKVSIDDNYLKTANTKLEQQRKSMQSKLNKTHVFGWFF